MPVGVATKPVPQERVVQRADEQLVNEPAPRYLDEWRCFFLRNENSNVCRASGTYSWTLMTSSFRKNECRHEQLGKLTDLPLNARMMRGSSSLMKECSHEQFGKLTYLPLNTWMMRRCSFLKNESGEILSGMHHSTGRLCRPPFLMNVCSGRLPDKLATYMAHNPGIFLLSVFLRELTVCLKPWSQATGSYVCSGPVNGCWRNRPRLRRRLRWWTTRRARWRSSTGLWTASSFRIGDPCACADPIWTGGVQGGVGARSRMVNRNSTPGHGHARGCTERGDEDVGGVPWVSACDSLRLCCGGSWIFPISWYLARCGLMQVGEVCIVDASVVFSRAVRAWSWTLLPRVSYLAVLVR